MPGGDTDIPEDYGVLPFDTMDSAARMSILQVDHSFCLFVVIVIVIAIVIIVVIIVIVTIILLSYFCYYIPVISIIIGRFAM